MVIRYLIAATLSCASAAAAVAQPLSLDDALRTAHGSAYANRMAVGHAAAQAGDGMKALQGILPSMRVEAGYARTTDPIGTFGMTLRQRTIAQSDFDPARLNYPDARVNYGAALVLEQPLVNLDAHWGRRAAGHATAAATAIAEWTRTGTSVDVVRAYYGAVLIGERVAALESAQRTAAAHVRQAESMAREGVVTRSDELLARVRSGEVEAQLAEARGDALLAKRRLAVLLGRPADTLFTMPTQLPEAAVLASLEDPVSGAGIRGDVQAARAGEAAAQADVRRARALLLPRLNAVARYDWNSPASPFAGDENWSVGVMATWSPTAGGSQLAEMRAAGGRAAAAGAQAEAAQAVAELEAAASANAWRVAMERVRIAASAMEQSSEAHRIVTRRYEGGLASVVELLGASAAATEAQLRYSAARYDALIAAAERLQSSGRDPAELAGLLSQQNIPEQNESGK
jgi:outer membrane protein